VNQIVHFLLPYLILFGSVALLILLFARRWTEAKALADHEEGLRRSSLLGNTNIRRSFWLRLRSVLHFYRGRIWRWLQEAKDLTPHPVASYRLKRLIKRQGYKSTIQPIIPPIVEEKAISEDAPVEQQAIAEEQSLEQILLQRLQDDPKDMDSLGELGKLYLQEEKIAQAADVYEYMTKLEPASAGWYAKLGYCNLQLEQYASAVTNYEKSLGLDAAHPNRYYNLALAYEGLHNTNGARKSFKQALTLDPDNTKYKIALNTLNRNAREAKNNGV
jgi:tetratricopeptide (TPR) repeat protein